MQSSLSPFIVGKNSQAPYNSIQLAINAASLAGGGTVYLQQGLYEENLVLCDRVDIWGAIGIADTQTCIIKGEHTPPTSGNISIRNIALHSQTSIFKSLKPGTSSLFLTNCFIKVKDGYVFELPNWIFPGRLIAFDLGDGGSENNGYIYNLKGATSLVVAAAIGAGSKRKMTLSGESNFYTALIRCPVDLQNNTSGIFTSGCCFEQTLSLKDQASTKIFNASFCTDNEIAIQFESSSSVLLAEIVIDSSHAPVIAGEGNGIINIGSISFTRSAEISENLSVISGTLRTGNVVIGGVGNGLFVPEGKNAKIGSCILSSGEAFVSTAAVKNTSKIFLSYQECSEDFGSLAIKSREPGKGFLVISSNIKDSSKFSWIIIDPS